MGQFLQDSTMQIVSESNLSGLLAHFNTDLIFDIIETSIETKFDSYQSIIPNIINSYEQQFKDLSVGFPFGVEEINDVREKTYLEIITILCNKHDLTFNPETQADIYTTAMYLYQFLVSSFKNNIVAFFANFIVKEKNYLFESLQLAQFKKNKDSNSLYNKRIYKNQKVAGIISQIDYVIDSICRFDITFDALLRYMTPDKNIVDFLSSIVQANGDFFKDQIVSVLRSDSMRSMILMDIRIAVQKLSQINDVDITGQEDDE